MLGMPSTSGLTRVLIKGESGWSELREVLLPDVLLPATGGSGDSHRCAGPVVGSGSRSGL